MSKTTCDQVFEPAQTFRAVASVAPDVLRTCIWIWSYRRLSGQCGWYQKLSVGLPVGTVTVCVSVLFPLTALVEPSRAEYEPECGVVPPGIVTFCVRMLLPLNGDAEPSCAA